MLLKDQKCVHNDTARSALDANTRDQLLSEQLADWEFDAQIGAIKRKFRFKNYYHTMGFVNAVAWIANKQAHHPDLEVSYGHCLVKYTTHDAGNSVCMNDLICAAQIDALDTNGSFGPNFVTE
ncbi:4a-hydroxytetrahydrobiopterin dehydratase [Kangiella sp. TOML190]|uniref:4a-hydroxytetrahydrobiopterin dehydratase n=1 Tax=Kangiella sp. TOML190 TaxID=2931351 RepID=UPI00203B9D60|nr:4a-hydroxytetrahydrobiopterin dehydratase [Kangiella sp. TOML190]